VVNPFLGDKALAAFNDLGAQPKKGSEDLFQSFDYQGGNQREMNT
jgi:hypothetical protein